MTDNTHELYTQFTNLALSSGCYDNMSDIDALRGSLDRIKAENIDTDLIKNIGDLFNKLLDKRAFTDYRNLIPYIQMVISLSNKLKKPQPQP